MERRDPRNTMIARVMLFMIASGLLAALGVLLAAYLMGRDWRDLELPFSWVLIAVFMIGAAFVPPWRSTTR